MRGTFLAIIVWSEKLIFEVKTDAFCENMLFFTIFEIVCGLTFERDVRFGCFLDMLCKTMRGIFLAIIVWSEKSIFGSKLAIFVKRLSFFTIFGNVSSLTFERDIRFA